MRVESFRHEHGGRDEHRPAPELREQSALDSDVANVFRVLRRLDRRDGLVEHEFQMPACWNAARGERDLAWFAVRIAGLEIPVLTFALIRRQRQRVPVGAVEGFVAIEQHLHRVRAGFQVGDFLDRVTLRVGGNRDAVAALEVIDVHAEHDLRFRRQIDLVARLVAVVIGEQQHQTALLRLFAAARQLRAESRIGRVRGRDGAHGQACAGQPLRESHRRLPRRITAW